MGNMSWQLLILLILAIVVFMRLFNEFGKRDGHEPERKLTPEKKSARNDPEPEEIEEIDADDTTVSAIARARMVDPSFKVDTFLKGAKSAYEMILMAYLNGDVEPIKPYVHADVYDGFVSAIEARKAQGHEIKAEFIGFQDVKLYSAQFDDNTNELEIGVEFVSQLKQHVVDAKGKVIEGDKSKIETQHDKWFFVRNLKSDDPNWMLVATDE